MRASGQKLVKFCTHTDTHTAELVVAISDIGSCGEVTCHWLDCMQATKAPLHSFVNQLESREDHTFYH